MVNAMTTTNARPPERQIPSVLPDFVHTVWKSEASRERWEPRMAAIQTAWSEIEWRSVVAGVRRCALTILRPDAWIELSQRLAPHGLVAFPLQLHSSTGTYSNRGAAAAYGEPIAIRVVVGQLDDAAAMRRAWCPTDDQTIGTLLGFPACCREFFQAHWVAANAVDMTWPMALNEGAVAQGADGEQIAELGGPPEANILLRWIGLRAVPHMPCSSRCEASAEMGRRMIQVGRDAGFGREMDWLLEAMSWPVSWESVGPIATVTTPCLAFAVNTEPAPGRRVVKRPDGA
jgi:hypothetical protein